VSGPGRRRKPNPDEEGYVPPGSEGPADPGRPAAPQPDPSAQYAYDWRRPEPPAQPAEPPSFGTRSSGAQPFAGQQPYDARRSFEPPSYGAQSFEPRPPGIESPDGRFSAPPETPGGRPTGRQPGPGPVFGGYTPAPDPLGHRLQDPYSPSAYRAAPPSVPQASSAPAAPPIVPPQPGAPRRPAGGGEPTGLFDDDDLFGDVGAPQPGRSGGYPAAPPPAAPARPAPAADPGDGFGGEDPFAGTGSDEPAVRPRAGAEYSPADFGFVDEESGNDVEHWLTFAESRADSRAERARRFRHRLIAVAAVLALAGAGFGAYVLFAGNPLAPASTATKAVIMFQLRDPSGNAVGDALLIADDSAVDGKATGHGGAVLIPSQLVVNTIAFGDQPFGGEMTANPPVLPAQADTVSDLLGVNIDGVWGMDETTFAALVDEMNGLPVTTTVAVPAQGTAPAVPLGSDTLSGAQSIAYLTYAPKGEQPAAQVDRFGQIVTALLKTLPTDPIVINGYLNHLGIVNDPALPNSRLTPILAALASEEQSGKFVLDPLPMRTDGSDELDYQGAGPIVTNLLGGALKSGAAAGQLPRVLVEDGSGASGQTSSAQRNSAEATLANAGYTAADGGGAPYVAATAVEIPDSGEQAAAQQVAATLGLPTSDVKVVPGLSAVADVTVVLGADWPKLSSSQGAG
jgi:LytR cell envelope-related transcriptional attenuator